MGFNLFLNFYELKSIHPVKLKTMVITNEEELQSILSKLTQDTPALWGKMNAQNMIEHLAMTLRFSNGKMLLKGPEDLEAAAKAKAYLIYSDTEMVQGVKSKLMGDEPPALVYPDLSTALAKLADELSAFRKTFSDNPNQTYQHPRLGELDYGDWIIFHSKHFRHHFRQFGLL
jgi:hypothetical protein